MNELRRSRIFAAKDRIAALLVEAESIKNELEEVRDEEQEYRYNMPESFSNGEKGEQADIVIENLDQVIFDFESLAENDWFEPLDSAAE